MLEPPCLPVSARRCSILDCQYFKPNTRMISRKNWSAMYSSKHSKRSCKLVIGPSRERPSKSPKSCQRTVVIGRIIMNMIITTR
jgi:hypothetical protein